MHLAQFKNPWFCMQHCNSKKCLSWFFHLSMSMSILSAQCAHTIGQFKSVNELHHIHCFCSIAAHIDEVGTGASNGQLPSAGAAPTNGAGAGQAVLQSIPLQQQQCNQSVSLLQVPAS